MSPYTQLSNLRIGPGQCAKLLLVAHRKTGVAVIYLNTSHEKSDVVKSFITNILNLQVMDLHEPLEHDETAVLIVTKTQEDLKKYLTAYNEHDQQTTHEMMGWPQTSIDVLVGKEEELPLDEYPADMQPGCPLVFKLSKAYAPEEIQVFYEYMHEVKKFCQSVYAKMQDVPTPL